MQTKKEKTVSLSRLPYLRHRSDRVAKRKTKPRKAPKLSNVGLMAQLKNRVVTKSQKNHLFKSGKRRFDKSVGGYKNDRNGSTEKKVPCRNSEAVFNITDKNQRGHQQPAEPAPKYGDLPKIEIQKNGKRKKREIARDSTVWGRGIA